MANLRASEADAKDPRSVRGWVAWTAGMNVVIESKIRQNTLVPIIRHDWKSCERFNVANLRPSKADA